MSELIERLKSYYFAAKKCEHIWYDYYPNNMLNNEKSGIYTVFWFRDEDKWMFLKYTIEYMSRVDAEGFMHPEEGVKYYVLHEYESTQDKPLTIPAPADNDRFEYDPETEFDPDIVNSFGRFRYVFDDEETAKAVISGELLRRIYPYLFILNEDERSQWKQFIETYDN